MRLYETPRTRSSRCRWVLQELGVPFESVQVDLFHGEQRATDFLDLNPFGRVPVLIDDQLVLSESIAICLYLADKYKEKGLVPPSGTPERGVHDQWLLFCATEIDQPLWQIRRHTTLYPPEKQLSEEVAISRENFHQAAAVLEQGVRGKKHLINDAFTVVDIVLSQTLLWASGYGLLTEHPGLETYFKTHIARSACPDELRS